MFSIYKNKRKAALRRKMRHERLSKYKTLFIVTYEQKWRDARPDYVAVRFEENGYGERNVDFGGYDCVDVIRRSKWWADYVVPWLNHIPRKEESAKQNNVVKLKLVKESE